MVTKEWVAIHRKHHAKCETVDDPHSPQTRGIKTVLLTGAELYRAEAKNQETMAKYGHGTPDDWIERNLYTRFSWQGVGLMLIVNLSLFGAIGATVWAVQMLWIPITAAGIINGIGHWWGYRNFEAADASTNISPWGIADRRRGAAQQPPHLSDVGQAVGQAVRVRHRLGLHPRAGDARPGQGAQDRAEARARRRQAGGRRQDARGDHRQPLRGDGQLCARAARAAAPRSSA